MITLEAGTVLISSWGYDQTNVDFYIVEKGAKVGEFATIRMLQTVTTTEGDTMTGYSVPGEPVAKTMRRKVKQYTDLPLVGINSYAIAKPWDGKPARTSWYA